MYDQVKEQRLPASQLLQQAVAAELRRRELESTLDAYLTDLIAEVGQPSPDAQARADALAARVLDRNGQAAP